MEDLETFALPGSVASRDSNASRDLAPPENSIDTSAGTQVEVGNGSQLEYMLMLQRHVKEVEAIFQQHQQDLLSHLGNAMDQKLLQQQQQHQQQEPQPRRWPSHSERFSPSLPVRFRKQDSTPSIQGDRPENPLAKLLTHKDTRGSVMKPRTRTKSLADVAMQKWSGKPTRANTGGSASSGTLSAQNGCPPDVPPTAQMLSVASFDDKRGSRHDMESVARLQHFNRRTRLGSENQTQEPLQNRLGWHGVLVASNKDDQQSKWMVARGVMTLLGLKEKEQKRPKTPSENEYRNKVTIVTQSRPYELAYICITLFDICMLLWETQLMSWLVFTQALNAQGGLRDSRSYIIIADFVCLTFIIDISLRIYAHGLEPLRSSIPDVGSVLIYVFQVIVNHAWIDERASLAIRVVSSHLSIFRVARLVRILQVSRFVRKLPAFRTLRLIAYALSSSNAVGTLLCICATIFGICLFFGVFLTEGSMAFLVQHGPDDYPLLHQSFGTTYRSVFSLYQAMTGGEDWANIYNSLEPMGWVYKVAFIAFQGFTWIALMNVVTASFVENTLQRSKEDREFMVQTEIEVKKSYIDAMKEIFRGLDDDGSGSIEIGELQECLHRPDLGAWFASLGIDVEQVGNLFKLLDRDKSGTLDEEEFIFGCLQLRGEARNIDVALLQYQVAELSDHVAALGEVLASLVVDESIQIPPKGQPPALPK